MSREGNGADRPLREVRLRAVRLHPYYQSAHIWTRQPILRGALFSQNGTPWKERI